MRVTDRVGATPPGSDDALADERCPDGDTENETGSEERHEKRGFEHKARCSEVVDDRDTATAVGIVLSAVPS
ncbi:hypothetical protein HSB1_42030 [Halogranum salarium B-1]|uniref:Uncharacterized protein n=1 Tax=Halogranum salarium B-1 TaxID=1210908 RepID=J2ZA33_9EURY|nr:hypothetical protein HSB1_42030 [Halogranum salarium B-1]